MDLKLIIMSAIMAAVSVSCNSNSKSGNNSKNDSLTSSTPAKIHEEPVSYSLNGTEYKSFITYNEDQKGIRPAVLVVPEWWGLNDYPRSRAKQLAELGYIAMAVDVYGDGKIAENPQKAQEFTTPFYKDPTHTKIVLDAALNKLKSNALVDTSRIAAIGYCFGGFVVLNAAKLGADLKGVVSFHGGLEGVKPDKNKIKAKILVCHGADDQFENPHLAEFKKQMDSAGVDYTFKQYPNATHAFTNPAATETGKKFNMPITYNAAAESASWNDMKEFFKRIF